MSKIQDEFLWVAKHALRLRPGVETLRVRAIQPSKLGPVVAYEHGPIGPPPPMTNGEPSREPPAATVLEGVGRVLQVRWRGGPPIPGRPDDTSWREGISRVYPKTFDAGGPHSWPGWRFIWLAAAEWIQDIGMPKDWECGQTKEKFGTLRWYVYGSLNEKHHSVIRTMEIISGHTCEYCGAPGRLRRGAWAKVACDEHARGEKAVSHDD